MRGIAILKARDALHRALGITNVEPKTDDGRGARTCRLGHGGRRQFRTVRPANVSMGRLAARYAFSTPWRGMSWTAQACLPTAGCTYLRGNGFGKPKGATAPSTAP